LLHSDVCLVCRELPLLSPSTVLPPTAISRTPFLNAGHALDHLIMLIFPAAALSMTAEFGLTYAELLPLSLGAFIAFGACSLPAGWLGDRWSLDGMMGVFFIGSGAACGLTAMAKTPLQLAICLSILGAFAAIYHPIAPALLVNGTARRGRVLGINGFFGNFGVASAALTTGVLTDLASWRAAFAAPGAVLILIGLVYIFTITGTRMEAPKSVGNFRTLDFRFGSPSVRTLFIRLFAIILLAGLIFNATTVAMPKLFDERLTNLTSSATGVGVFVFGVFLFAGFAQLIAGPLIDRYSEKPVLTALLVLQIPCLALVTFADGWLLAISAAAMMFCVFGQIPVHDAMIARNIAAEYRARAYALRYFVSFGASAAAIPMIAAASGGRMFEELLATLTVLTAIAFVIAVRLPRATQAPVL